MYLYDIIIISRKLIKSSLIEFLNFHLEIIRSVDSDKLVSMLYHGKNNDFHLQ